MRHRPSRGTHHLPIWLLYAYAISALEPPAQALQPPPLAPHLAVVLPLWQVTPSQQPLQHCPLRQTPPLHLVPSLSPELVHEPDTQVPEEQGLLVLEQLAQAPPALPQAASRVPALHTTPAQQPLQVLAVHLLPQPSSAPAHFPAQFGVQRHWPELQVSLALQLPQLPPQPSDPHFL